MSKSVMKSIARADVAGKRVLVRADLNVPVRDGEITDVTRIERFMPTVKDLLERGAKVIIMSHFGRPKGKNVPDMSLLPVAQKLAHLLKDKHLLNAKVRFAENCIGPAAQKAVGELENGQVALLENLRYHEGEEGNDEAFAKELAQLGDIYVNDAFSCSHRAHASTHAIAWNLPAYVGPSMKAELDALSAALDTPKRPTAAIVGGAKVSTKIPVLTNLAKKMDMLVIGGGMANTFMFAQGQNIGNSLCEPDFADEVHKIFAAAKESGCKILLPIDVVVAEEFKESAHNVTYNSADVAADETGMILDAGPKTVDMYKEHLQQCQTVLWNGPLGAFEIKPFGVATFELAREAAKLSRENGLISVAGGGDTVAALNTAGVSEDFTYISTAGGAFLEWLEGRELPGVVALEIGN
ncbi:MAG: phosphoglycerate kinase [bacterium]|nr:phosphoglycerate kinase [bacterium]